MAESLPLETKEYFFACTRREGFWQLQMLELLIPPLDCIRFEFGVPQGLGLGSGEDDFCFNRFSICVCFHFSLPFQTQLGLI